MAQQNDRPLDESLRLLDEALAHRIETKATGPKRPPPASIRELEFASTAPAVPHDDRPDSVIDAEWDRKLREAAAARKARNT